MRTRKSAIFTAFAMSTTMLLGVGCASNQDTLTEMPSSYGHRIYQIELVDQPISGVINYDQSRTSGMIGKSPFATDLGILDAEQQAAINAIKEQRERDAKAGF